MKTRALIIELGIKNIEALKKQFNLKNIEIIYASSFLDVVDTIYLQDVHIIVLSDFRGIKPTIGYIKMFITTNPEFKVIILSNDKAIEEENSTYLIERGADSYFSCYDINSIEKRFTIIQSKILKNEEEPNEWCYCTKKAIRYLKLNYHIQDNLIDKLCSTINYSPSSIYHSVKKDTGTSLGDWLQQIRVRGATELLKSTELPIKSISLKVGYKSIQGFLKAFKKITGKTPTDIRNDYHKEY